MKLIHSADLHLRPERPKCRLDENWEETMRRYLGTLVNLARLRKAKLLIAGDIFDTSQMPHWVVNLFLSEVLNAIIFAGNHDFKYQNLSNIDSSAIGHLLKNPMYQSLIPERDNGFVQLTSEIMVCHRLVLQPGNTELAKFKTGIGVEELIEEALEENPEVKWILTGDNHHHFHYVSEEGIHVVNPGSPLVFNAKMIGEKCGCYFIDTDENIVEFVEVEDSADLLTDEYLRKAEAHSDGLRAIVELLNSPDSENEEKSGDFLERCDLKSQKMPKESKNMYEDIKNQIVADRDRKGA